MIDIRATELRSCIEADLVKIADCSQRIKDSLPIGGESFKDLGYVAKQIAFLMAAGSDMRKSLEALQDAGNLERAKKLALDRMRDPAYTPEVSEVLESPDAFMEGFRES